jgi:hypothetical protein
MHGLSPVFPSTKSMLDEQFDSSSMLRFKLHSAFSLQRRKQYVAALCVTQPDPAGQSALVVQPLRPQ